MVKLEDLIEGTVVEGIVAGEPVTVIHVKWFGGQAMVWNRFTEVKRPSSTCSSSEYTYDGKEGGEAHGD